MTSIIEKSLQEYQDFLAGKNSTLRLSRLSFVSFWLPNQLKYRILKLLIEYNQPCARQPLDDSSGCFVVK